MARRVRVHGLWFCAVVVGVVLAAACSNNTAPHQATPCPTYTAGNVPGTSLVGGYDLVSFCQDTEPALVPPIATGTLTLTSTDFNAIVTIMGQQPVQLAGPYTLPTNNTISVSLPPPLSIDFVATYTFRNDTLYVSGTLPGTTQGLALVFLKTS